MKTSTADAARATRAPRFINPDALAAPRGYNNGVIYGPDGGSLVFLAGQIGSDASGQLVSEHFTDQFDQALANVITIVTEAGGTAASVGKLTIYVLDKNVYAAARKEIGERYRKRMGTHYPAMTLVEVKGLLEPGALVEIEGLAWL
jgi:enamine deaminase RidA (YjgF/YER057c/UK114 family)